MLLIMVMLCVPLTAAAVFPNVERFPVAAPDTSQQFQYNQSLAVPDNSHLHDVSNITNFFYNYNQSENVPDNSITLDILNITNFFFNYNQSLAVPPNVSTISVDNITDFAFNYNQSLAVPPNSTTISIDNVTSFFYNYNQSLAVPPNSTTISVDNITDFQFNYNQTEAVYNYTEAGQDIFLNLTGTNANQNINVTPFNFTLGHWLYFPTAALHNLVVDWINVITNLNVTGSLLANDLNISGDTILNNLEVTGNVTGNIVIEGNLTGTFFFGGMFTDDATGILIPIPGLNTPVNVTDYTSAEELNGFEFNGPENETLIAKEPGFYKADYSISFTGGANEQYRFELARNGAVVPGSESTITVGSGGTVWSVAGTSLVRMNEDDILTLRVQQESNPIKDITYFTSSVNIVRVGN